MNNRRAAEQFDQAPPPQLSLVIPARVQILAQIPRPFAHRRRLGIPRVGQITGQHSTIVAGHGFTSEMESHRNPIRIRAIALVRR
jgi:hypothetical protein